jgi:hypothetical protein
VVEEAVDVDIDVDNVDVAVAVAVADSIVDASGSNATSGVLETRSPARDALVILAI